jgi:hypothetical protein
MDAEFYLNRSEVSELKSLTRVYMEEHVDTDADKSEGHQKVRRVYEYIRDNKRDAIKEAVFDETIPTWVRRCGSAFLSLNPMYDDLDFLVDVANSEHMMGCMAAESVVGIAKLAKAGNG